MTEAKEHYAKLKDPKDSFDEWLNKDLSECVLNEEPECKLFEGKVMSTPMVSTSQGVVLLPPSIIARFAAVLSFSEADLDSMDSVSILEASRKKHFFRA